MFEGRPVILEIGFGMGEATAQMAAADPDTGILACDVHTPGQGNLLGLAERNGLSNIRVANGDAIILLREMLAPASLAGLRVYFPDPWPKKRHHKRRLIQPEFIARPRPGSRPAPWSTARPTGSRTRSRCSMSSPPSRPSKTCIPATPAPGLPPADQIRGAGPGQGPRRPRPPLPGGARHSPPRGG
ncbi:tRNA (guanine-N(7)-)-methyltransferase [Streptomyces rimosus subsp. rimosus]